MVDNRPTTLQVAIERCIELAARHADRLLIEQLTVIQTTVGKLEPIAEAAAAINVDEYDQIIDTVEANTFAILNLRYGERLRAIQAAVGVI